MTPRMGFAIVTQLTCCVLILTACSTVENLPPATATAQAQRIQRMATQMAAGLQSTSAISQQKATESADAALALLKQAESWQAVISDTFDDNHNGWPTGAKDSDLSSEQLSIENGKYNWSATAKDGFVYWTTPTTDTVKDFYAAVDAQQIGGPEDGDVNLLFHESDTSNYYLFEVSNVGKFSVNQLVADGWQTRIDWTDSADIQPTQTNHLAVIGKGTDYYFFINGTQVGTYSESEQTEGSTGVGIALYHKDDKGTFSFDNFELRVPLSK